MFIFSVTTIFAFSDFPYNVGKDYGVSKDNMLEEEYLKMITKIIDNFRRITKRGFAIYTDWKHFKMFWNLIPEAEPIIIFKKSSGIIYSNLNIVQHHHIILVTGKCLKKNLKSLWDDIRVLGEGYLFNEKRFGNHPAQTSLKATQRIIEHFTEEDEVVLDCFMGVGTTAVACKQLKRRFIGLELNPEYIKIANKRLNQEIL